MLCFVFYCHSSICILCLTQSTPWQLTVMHVLFKVFASCSAIGFAFLHKKSIKSWIDRVAPEQSQFTKAGASGNLAG